jgi:Domain of unknown function (DUF4359)
MRIDMKNAGLTAIVIILTGAVALVATNPTTQQYQAFLEKTLARAVDKMEGPETARERKVIRDLLRSEGKKLVESLARANTVRKSYGFFSVFQTGALGVSVEVLGIAGMFFPLEDERELNRKLGQLAL